LLNAIVSARLAAPARWAGLRVRAINGPALAGGSPWHSDPRWAQALSNWRTRVDTGKIFRQEPRHADGGPRPQHDHFAALGDLDAEAALSARRGTKQRNAETRWPRLLLHYAAEQQVSANDAPAAGISCSSRSGASGLVNNQPILAREPAFDGRSQGQPEGSAKPDQTAEAQGLPWSVSH